MIVEPIEMKRTPYNLAKEIVRIANEPNPERHQSEIDALLEEISDLCDAEEGQHYIKCAQAAFNQPAVN